MNRIRIPVYVLFAAAFLAISFYVWLGGKSDRKSSSLRGKITIGRETTYLTEPIDKDGNVDYGTAVNGRLRKDVTSENNANVLIWKAIGPRAEGTTMCPEFFQAMGMTPPPEKGDCFLRDYEFVKQALPVDADPEETYFLNESMTEGIKGATQRPWIAKEYPIVASWLKANEKPLLLITEASKREKFYNPLLSHKDGKLAPRQVSFPVHGLDTYREIGAALVARALLHTAEGNVEAAWQDFLTCHRLGRLVARGGTVCEGLCGLTIDNQAAQAALAFLERTKPDAKRIATYLRDLQALPPLPNVSEKMDLTERCAFLQLVRIVEEDRPKGLFTSYGEKPFGYGDANYAFLVGVDWDPALSAMNVWFDRMVGAMKEPDRATKLKKFAEIDKDYLDLKDKVKNPLTFAVLPLANSKEKGRIVGDYVTWQLLLPYRKIQNDWDKSQQIHDNTRIAFALAAYRGDTGHYPKDLSELSPKYLKEIPNDIFSSEPLIYRPTAAGYHLHSVGPDGQDDIAIEMPLPALKKP